MESSSHWNGEIGDLVLHMIRDPLFTSTITQLTIREERHYVDDDSDYGLVNVSGFNTADWDGLKSILTSCSTRLGFSSKRYLSWWTAIEARDWHAMAGLALLQLPALEVLVLDEFGLYREDNDDVEESQNFFEMVVDKVSLSQEDSEASKHLLSGLKTLNISYCDTENGLRFETLSRYLRIPSVECFTVFSAAGEEMWTPGPSDNFKVKRLELIHSNADSVSLKALLSRCSALEIFVFEEGGATVGFSDLAPQELGGSFSHLKGHLRELDINDTETWETGPHDEQSTRSFLRSFKDFEKLERLSLMSTMLLGKDQDGDLAEVIPKTLKSLHLRWCNETGLQSVEKLKERVQEVAPGLNDISTTAEGRKHYSHAVTTDGRHIMSFG